MSRPRSTLTLIVSLAIAIGALGCGDDSAPTTGTGPGELELIVTPEKLKAGEEVSVTIAGDPDSALARDRYVDLEALAGDPDDPEFEPLFRLSARTATSAEQAADLYPIPGGITITELNEAALGDTLVFKLPPSLAPGPYRIAENVIPDSDQPDLEPVLELVANFRIVD